ncbi:MAG: hypothetical protein ACW980_24575 [Promethearchaeota archaeon]|jgi:hypothetical protein
MKDNEIKELGKKIRTANNKAFYVKFSPAIITVLPPGMELDILIDDGYKLQKLCLTRGGMRRLIKELKKFLDQDEKRKL